MSSIPRLTRSASFPQTVFEAAPQVGDAAPDAKPQPQPVPGEIFERAPMAPPPPVHVMPQAPEALGLIRASREALGSVMGVGWAAAHLAVTVPKAMTLPFAGALAGAQFGLNVAAFEADPHVGAFPGWNFVWFAPLAISLNAGRGFAAGVREGVGEVTTALF
jgi:hypothetical protein